MLNFPGVTYGVDRVQDAFLVSGHLNIARHSNSA
jgi:hypothetical protein